LSAVRSIYKKHLIGDINNIITTPLVSGDMSANIIGPVTVVDKIDQVCYQVSWVSMDAVGTISVQGSIDNENFEDLTFNPILMQPSSNNGSYLINLALIPFPYIRLKYTMISGSGNLNVWGSGKGV
jgi:hypothetical protein